MQVGIGSQAAVLQTCCQQIWMLSGEILVVSQGQSTSHYV